MRITGGEFCGRRMQVPRGDRVRPTQDRVREALFSMLATVVPESRFLDLYAGSGVVGLEALSRGAAEVVWVESDRRTVQVTQANVALVAGPEARVVCADCRSWVATAGRGRRFDVVFADPPYDRTREAGFAGLMAALRSGDVVAVGGLFVAEQPVVKGPETVDGWGLLRDRAYGHTRLLLYRREN